MACFSLAWDNTEVLANPNNTTQTSYWRYKGDVPWLNTGFDDANPMPTSQNVIDICSLDANRIVEFKVESECTENGPVSNNNGTREQIAFVCIEPVLSNTDVTAQAVVSLVGTAITKVRFTLRKASDNTIVFGPTIITSVANQAIATATGLTGSTAYYWQTVLYTTINGVEVNSSQSSYLNTVCGPYNLTTDAPVIVEDLIWIPLAVQCEKEGGFGVVKTISGLSSPYTAWYDVASNLVYIADQDDAAGNVYWFNPDTATLPAHMTHSTQIIDPALYNTYIDGPNKKIYFVGANTGGMLVYNIITDTVTTPAAFGTNGAFNRTLLTVTSNRIYCNDAAISIIIINRETQTILSTVPIAGIPLNGNFLGGVIQLIEATATNELYAITSNGTTGTVGVYNTALDTSIAVITLPGAATWTGGGSKYWQGGFYDPVSQRMFITDIGSSKLFIIDVVTHTVVQTIDAVNRQGKANAGYNGMINPVNGDLYIGYTGINNSVDASPIKRMYLMNRTGFVFSNMFENQYYINGAGIPGTTNVVGTSPGLGAWSGMPASATDGVITLVSTTTGSQNTGKKIVVTLQEVDANDGNAPTGETANNTVLDGDGNPNPNYIPDSTDLVTCPLTLNTACPTDVVTTFSGATLNYEVAVAASVINNPAVLKMQIYAYNIGTASVEGSPVTINDPTLFYYAGSFGGLGGVNYTIQVRFLGAADAILNTCTL